MSSHLTANESHATTNNSAPVEHTPGPWRDGNTADSIVADLPEGVAPDENSNFYGGLVVAESVSSNNKPLVKAAPDLLDFMLKEEALLQDVWECDFCFQGDGLCSGEDGGPNHFAAMLELDELRSSLIAKATGRKYERKLDTDES